MSFETKFRWVTNYRNSPTPVFKPLYIELWGKIDNITALPFMTKIGITAHTRKHCLIYFATGRHIDDDVTKGVDIIIDHFGCIYNL